MNLTISILAVSGLLAGVTSSPQPETPARAARPAGVPRVLVMKDLARKPVKLLSIGEEQVQIAGVRGRTTSVPRREVLAILPDGPLAVVRPEGMAQLRTVAGETIIGKLETPAEGEKAGEKIRWRTLRLGELTVDLEQVSSVEFASVATDPGPRKASEDRVVLTNGDVLAGFVEEVAATVRVEVAKQPREAPLDRVARVEFANPVKPLTGAVAWLATGEVLRISGVAGSGGDLTLTRDGKPVTVAAADLIGVVENAAVLLPLAAIPATVTPGAGRSWADPLEISGVDGPLGAGDILLPSPMAATWTLPPKARRVSMTVMLPPAARVWGDCVVVVQQGGASGARDLATVRLNGDRPESEINVELTVGMGPLRVRVDEGENGPIQDRVLLRQPLVLVDP